MQAHFALEEKPDGLLNAAALPLVLHRPVGTKFGFLHTNQPNARYYFNLNTRKHHLATC